MFLVFTETEVFTEVIEYLTLNIVDYFTKPFSQDIEKF